MKVRLGVEVSHADQYRTAGPAVPRRQVFDAVEPAGAQLLGAGGQQRFVNCVGALTTLNLQGVLRVRDRLPANIRDRVEVATYDQTIRVNITLINNSVCVAQQYLPHARGVESPTMVIKKRWPDAGLYPVFERTFHELWSGGQPR
ncbi:DUF5919 domain-containing protein [Actinoplanes oblitus]|uniref:DUF5919 domain-containing protein n=1 Tax=Actinoplanes oblitus TaxID=3040509 RepID=A0ABY8WRF5_9ACTN|nr:DUF5919 domain-containing protein [Actinoplanes oblitus]WIN00436.1 DUF5919 domain-containing protein [Actinoplanes oblitus]